MIKTALVCHADTPASFPLTIEVALSEHDGGALQLQFRVTPSGTLALPQPAKANRADGLWQHSCFELFLKPAAGEGYFEFNFSPSSEWAAYGFASYREGMRALDLLGDPVIGLEQEDEALLVTVRAALPASLAGKMSAGLSAVIEEVDGTKSYWALRHPPGKPDFHHADCFALSLG